MNSVRDGGIPPELLEQMQRGNIVLFCGAGISVSEGGIPTGTQLAQELAGRCGLDSTTGMSLPEIAQVYELQFGHHSLIALIAGWIDDPRHQPLRAHRLIAVLPFQCIITTNWDTLLEQALEQARTPFIKVVRDSEVAYADQSRVLLIKLHGSIEQKDSIVVTGDDYYGVFARLPETLHVVQSYIATRTLLFLGYSLEDNDFKRLYLEMTRHLGKHGRRAYAVQIHPPPVAIQYWQEKNVHIIGADVTDFLQALNKEALC